MNDRFQELSVFVRAAETGSFSHTARELGLSQPTVSRIVAGLEERLGVKLLLRTTRRMTPTEAGAGLLERARRVLGDLADAEDATRGLDSLRGVLRVMMSGAFGIREGIPHLPGFLARHPLLRVELLVSDRMDDLVAEAADMAVRLGPLAALRGGLARISQRLRRAPHACRSRPSLLHLRSRLLGSARLELHAQWRRNIGRGARPGAGGLCRGGGRLCKSRARGCSRVALDVPRRIEER
jgi:DNA-binding transcriptional LysR family regulator